jgi:hypothetical protein
MIGWILFAILYVIGLVYFISDDFVAQRKAGIPLADQRMDWRLIGWPLIACGVVIERIWR